jgi:hypothetical protein
VPTYRRRESCPYRLKEASSVLRLSAQGHKGQCLRLLLLRCHCLRQLLMLALLLLQLLLVLLGLLLPLLLLQLLPDAHRHAPVAQATAAAAAEGPLLACGDGPVEAARCPLLP